MMKSLAQSVFFSTLITLIDPIDCFQIPFLYKSSSSDAFQLQHAVHVGPFHQKRIRLRRDFNHHDRQQIDLLSQLADGQASYSTTLNLKTKFDTIWSHDKNLQKWKIAQKQQILIDRNLKNLQNLTQIFISNNLTTKSQLDWKQSSVEMPDSTDIQTLANLAKMTNDAYTLPGRNRWYDPDGLWNLSDSFGWENDGIRGHIFAKPDNSTIVIAIKGTSAGVLGNGGPTSAHDKLNDNLFFSCCCARVSWSWSPVCDCYNGANKCRSTCVENALLDKSVYFPAAVDLFNDVATMYPHSQIWLVGHSLGAALAGLMGATFGVPTIGFEAPGDLLPARRLHLPLPPGASFGKGQEKSSVIHVYHTADPIAMGTCNGALSTCSVAGYALETRCHIGQSIVF
ncbi:hypothetical protein O181_079703, partial [Austropuccinia psidii MF-1]|nr:hypothetical protein [Austropuccinia psidii MF-1]